MISKKAKISILILTLFMLAFTACGVTTYQAMPYGVWQSAEPNIVLIINPNRAASGTYIRDGEQIDIFAIVDTARGRGGIWVFNTSVDDPGNNRDAAYFRGDYRVRRGRLYLTFTPYWQERTGYERIVFEKVREA